MIGLSCLLQAEITRDSNTGIVSDTATQLEWQDNAVGSAKAWEVAITQCETLTLGGHSDWRLPNINELKSIVDRSKFNPTAVTGFINVDYYAYWSSSTYEGGKNSVWILGFYSGYTDTNVKNSNYYFKCVRDGQ